MREPSQKQKFLDEIAALERKVRELEDAAPTHRRMEEARLEGDRRFQSLLEATSDWIWEIGTDGRYTYASPKIKNLLGYEPEEVIGKSPFDLMPSDEAARVAGVFAAIAKRRIPFSGLENVNLHKDGHEVVLETNGVPVFGTGGNYLGYRGFDRDVTERSRARAERERLISELKEALSQVRTLSGLLPICASCKKIRDDDGQWQPMERYIRNHSAASFSHGICPECLARFYPGAAE